MHSSMLVKLVEDQYMQLLSNSLTAGNAAGRRFRGTGKYGCEEVQKFRDWLALVIKTTEVESDGVKIATEDVLVYAASIKSLVPPYRFLHPKLISALTLLRRADFDYIFGVKRRLAFERHSGIKVSVCRFRICFKNCVAYKSANCWKNGNLVPDSE